MNVAFEGWAVTQADFFEERTALERSDLVFTNDHVRSLVERLPTLVSFWDANLICRFANHTYSYWFGVNHLRLPGTTMQALLGPEMFAVTEPMIRAALQGERQDFDQLMIFAGGASRACLVTYLPTITDGVTTGFIVQIVEVTRLKAAEAALRQEIDEHTRTIEALAEAAERIRVNEATFRQTLRLNAQIAWAGSPDGSATQINALWDEAWEAVAGKIELGDIVQNIMTIVHEDDRERALSNSAQVAASPRTSDERYRVTDRAGRVRWMRFRAAPYFDDSGELVQWLGLIEDIDDAVRAEQRQQERDAAYRLTIDLSGQIPWSMSADGGVLWINDAAADRWAALTGRSAVEPAMDYATAAVHPDDLDRALADVSATIVSGLPLDFRYRLRLVDGSYRWWRSRASPLRDAKGKVLRWYGTLEDIHNQVIDDERLQRLEMEVAHFARLGAMESMASALAHELNQPLAAVTSYVGGARRLLATGGAENIALVESALVAAEAATLRSGRIIRSLRDMVTKVGIHRQPEHVAKLINDACVLAMIDARARGIAFRIDVDADVTTILVDSVQFKQVLINLMRNALDAVETAPVREVRIAARLRGVSVDISVSDTGKGIEPKILDKLFDAFNSTKPEGLGIGLSICRTIVEANRGTIAYAQASEGGACFTVSIPVAA